jgi:hypothetical protein
VLHRFAANPGEARETTEVHKDASGKEIFRYMAPLKADAYCLTCHKEHQGSAEEIRGGISVWFSYEPFRRLLSQTRERIWFLHVLGLVAALVPLGMMGRKLLGSVNALQASLLRVSQLEGLVPICASCKRIRTEGSDANAQTSWVPVELYIQDRTAAEFTHGLCPECRTRLYPGMKFGSEA